MNKQLIIIIVASAILLGGSYWYEQSQKQEEPYRFPPPAEDAPLTQRELDIQRGLIPDEPLVSNQETTHRNGQYRATAKYLSPTAEQYSLTVTIALVDEEITSAQVEHSQNALSEVMVAELNSIYKKQVLGERIDNAQLEVEEEPSAAINAFNNALRDIELQSAL